MHACSRSNRAFYVLCRLKRHMDVYINRTKLGTEHIRTSRTHHEPVCRPFGFRDWALTDFLVRFLLLNYMTSLSISGRSSSVASRLPFRHREMLTTDAQVSKYHSNCNDCRKRLVRKNLVIGLQQRRTFSFMSSPPLQEC